MDRQERIFNSKDLLVHKDDKKILVLLMKRWGIARRTAREYLDVLLENDK